MTVQEQEVRENFNQFVTDIVSKNGGELGNKRENTFDEMEKRANKAMEGARKYHKRMLQKN